MVFAFETFTISGTLCLLYLPPPPHALVWSSLGRVGDSLDKQDLNVVSSVQSLSHVWLLVTPWTAACQAPLSMEFSCQEYWDGLPFPSPGDLPDPRDWTRVSCTAGRFFTTWAKREAHMPTIVSYKTQKFNCRVKSYKMNQITFIIIYLSMFYLSKFQRSLKASSSSSVVPPIIFPSGSRCSSPLYKMT